VSALPISRSGAIVRNTIVNFRYVSAAIRTNIVIKRNVSPTGVTFIRLGRGFTFLTFKILVHGIDG